MTETEIAVYAVMRARDLWEETLARKMVVEILEEVRELPQDQRVEAATRKMHVRLLKEICDFKDRLDAQGARLLKEVSL